MRTVMKLKSEAGGASKPVRVMLYGLGPIGVATGKLALSKESIQVVGAVDIDPVKVGRDLGDALGLGKKLGVTVVEKVSVALKKTKADVVLHTTSSYIPVFFPQLVGIVSAGLSVVSSSEELFYPYLRGSRESKKLDALAKQKGVVILGTGVNPGFVMDTLPVVLTAVCQRVDSVKVTRIVDASTRRMPLQRKIGVGITPEEFRAKTKTGRFGHVGLCESLVFTASALGWQLDTVEETIEPVLAPRAFRTEFFKVKKGNVAGLRQVARGIANDRVLLTYELQMAAGSTDPHDRVEISGVPNLHVRVNGGTPGDLATPAMLINAIPRVLTAKPGLLTMRDLTLPGILQGVPVETRRA